MFLPLSVFPLFWIVGAAILFADLRYHQTPEEFAEEGHPSVPSAEGGVAGALDIGFVVAVMTQSLISMVLEFGVSVSLCTGIGRDDSILQTRSVSQMCGICCEDSQRAARFNRVGADGRPEGGHSRRPTRRHNATADAWPFLFGSISMSSLSNFGRRGHNFHHHDEKAA